MVRIRVGQGEEGVGHAQEAQGAWFSDSTVSGSDNRLLRWTASITPGGKSDPSCAVRDWDYRDFVDPGHGDDLANRRTYCDTVADEHINQDFNTDRSPDEHAN